MRAGDRARIRGWPGGSRCGPAGSSGEALTQAQRVAADRDALAALLVGGVDRTGADLAEVGPDVRTRLTEAHTARMAALGLSA